MHFPRDKIYIYIYINLVRLIYYTHIYYTHKRENIYDMHDIMIDRIMYIS